MSSGVPEGMIKGRLVKISGEMLGAYTMSENSRQAQRIEAKSLICIDISTCDPYPGPPARVWHPKFGKCWYVDTEYSTYEWLDAGAEEIEFVVSVSGGAIHSDR
jgi:hypothetical protein